MSTGAAILGSILAAAAAALLGILFNQLNGRGVVESVVSAVVVMEIVYWMSVLGTRRGR